MLMVLSPAFSAAFRANDDTSLFDRTINGKSLKQLINQNTARNGVRIPEKAINDAFQFYDRHNSTHRQYWENSAPPRGQVWHPDEETIRNKKYMVIFDTNQSSSTKRLHIVNLQTGEVTSTEAAHGAGSNIADNGKRCRSGYACSFDKNNDVNSKATPLGFFSTGPMYSDTNEHNRATIVMNGLESATASGFSGNDKVAAVAIHPAVKNGKAYIGKGLTGNSNGCPALDPNVMETWQDALKDGALFYFYNSQLDKYPDRLDNLSGALKSNQPTYVNYGVNSNSSSRNTQSNSGSSWPSFFQYFFNRGKAVK